MEEIKKQRTRMYEPWGYQEEDNYQSDEIIHENDLDSFFAYAEYEKTTNTIYFKNKDGEDVGSIDVSEFVKSDSIVESAEYVDGKIIITFTNGDVITVDLSDVIDINEFKDGLEVVSGDVYVKIDSTSEDYLSVSEDGVKVDGINAAIQVEVDRATSAETALQETLAQEVQERIDAVTAEENRAKTAEHLLDEEITDETNRAVAKESEIANALNDEISRSTSADTQLFNLSDIADQRLDRNEARILDLTNNLAAEVTRATNAETAINSKIGETSGDVITLLEKLGYKDNETLETKNRYEVAFGHYNVSNTGNDASEKTLFSVGIGTTDTNRKNAFEVRENGDVYMWVEGDYMQINDLLSMLAHETYNQNP